MNKLGIEASIRHVPELDPKYFPILRFNQAFLKTAKKPVTIAVERDRGQVAVCRTFIHGTDERYEADCYYMAPAGQNPSVDEGRLEGLCGWRRACGHLPEGGLFPRR